MKIPDIFVPKKDSETKIELLKEYNPKQMFYYEPNNIIIEPGVKEKWVTFDKSLKRLKKLGYERHLRPWESFGLLIDYLENNLEKKELKDLGRDMLESSGEWLSMAVKTYNNKLVCYIDPENIKFEPENNVYLVGKDIRYSDKKEFDITGIPLEKWISIEDFDDDFAKFFYTRTFKDLPEDMRKTVAGLEFILPTERYIHPIRRGSGINKFSIVIFGDSCTSRGVKTAR